MSISISALITNFNTWPLTQKCVTEFIHWSGNTLSEILVIDDASDEKTPDFLSNKVKIFRNLQNRGYVASVNVGFSKLEEDVIILFDSDAYPIMDITSSVRDLFANNPNLGAVGFQLVDEQKKPTGSHERLPTVLDLILGQTLTSRLQSWLPVKDESKICLYSCAIAVRRQAFMEIGGFDEGFDFLDADIDFSIRLQQAGWQVRVIPNLLAFHKGGGSPQTTAKRVLRYHKSRWRLLSKHQLLPVPKIVKICLLIRHSLEYLILKIGSNFVIEDSIILEDKLHSRKELLKSVWSNYGNEL